MLEKESPLLRPGEKTRRPPFGWLMLAGVFLIIVGAGGWLHEQMEGTCFEGGGGDACGISPASILIIGVSVFGVALAGRLWVWWRARRS